MFEKIKSKIDIITVISFLFSVCSIVLVLCKIEPITLDWMGILVGMFAILVAVLIGWQIYKTIEINQIEKKMEITQNKLDDGVRSVESKLRLEFYSKINTLEEEFEDFKSILIDARPVYYIPMDDIQKWPKLSNGVYKDDFVLKKNKIWLIINFLVKSSVSAEVHGNKPKQTILVKAKFVHPGMEESPTAFCRLALNASYVYLVQNKQGKYRVIGNKDEKTDTNCYQKDGKTTIEVSVTDKWSAPFYEGVIQIGGATVQGGLRTNDTDINE